jgi:hypothetical protein
MTAFTADQYIDGQFTWFTGVIEDRMDPEKMGRVRVRCFGFHSDSRGLIKTTDLPWATVMMPATGSTMSGIGNTPHALLPGTWVVGFFRDGPSAQDPIIMGSIGGMPDTKPDSAKGFSDPSGNYPTIVGEPDVNRLARGINTSPYDVDVSISEPAVPFAATYPHNKVIETESGHKIELDDTPGAERIRVHHHSGSFIEMHPEGDVVFRQKNKYNIVIENDNCHVQGSINLLVDGNVKQFIRGNLDVFTAGNMSFKSGGNISFDAAGGYTEAASTIHMNSAPANPFGPDAQRLVLALAGANAAFDDDELGENSDLVVPSEDIPVKQVITPDTTPEVAKPSPVLQSCDGITDANITDSMLLSPNFTLARLSSGAVFKHTVQAQAGNTKADIVCNLKALATNILEPLLAQYPGIRVNSGFRTVTKGKSQHEHGMACDIQWPGISNKEYLVRAQWIKANLPYDQLIFEHGNSIWLHLSHSRVLTNNNIPQRNKVLTYYPKVSPQYKPGITLHYA